MSSESVSCVEQKEGLNEWSGRCRNEHANRNKASESNLLLQAAREVGKRSKGRAGTNVAEGQEVHNRVWVQRFGGRDALVDHTGESAGDRRVLRSYRREGH